MATDFEALDVALFALSFAVVETVTVPVVPKFPLNVKLQILLLSVAEASANVVEPSVPDTAKFDVEQKPVANPTASVKLNEAAVKLVTRLSSAPMVIGAFVVVIATVGAVLSIIIVFVVSEALLLLLAIKQMRIVFVPTCILLSFARIVEATDALATTVPDAFEPSELAAVESEGQLALIIIL